VELRTDRRTLLRVWHGSLPFGETTAAGRLELAGERRPVAVFRALLERLSPLAYAVREARAASA